MKNKRFRLFLFVLLLTSSVCACGVRPSTVDPPQGAANDRFPQTYPAPEGSPDGGRYLP